MGKNVEIIRGTSNQFDITISDINGSLYTLKSGDKILFGVKKRATDTEYVILKTVTSGENGVYSVALEPDDTANLTFGKYFYDVGLETGDDYFNIIEPSLFEIKANITKWGDGQ